MQRKAETKKGSESSGEVYFTALGALEIYSVWSLALNADIKIITAVCQHKLSSGRAKGLCFMALLFSNPQWFRRSAVSPPSLLL